MIWTFNIIGLLLIGSIIWWFWIAKPPYKKISTAMDAIDIVVDNGVYEPAAIKLNANVNFKLRFFRKDPSPCAEWVVFPKLNISHELPLNKPHTVEIKIDNPGEYSFTCQMGMYRGKLIVE